MTAVTSDHSYQVAPSNVLIADILVRNRESIRDRLLQKEAEKEAYIDAYLKSNCSTMEQEINHVINETVANHQKVAEIAITKIPFRVILDKYQYDVDDDFRSKLVNYGTPTLDALLLEHKLTIDFTNSWKIDSPSVIWPTETAGFSIWSTLLCCIVPIPFVVWKAVRKHDRVVVSGTLKVRSEGR